MLERLAEAEVGSFADDALSLHRALADLLRARPPRRHRSTAAGGGAPVDR
jgi:hypothetical protein